MDDEAVDAIARRANEVAAAWVRDALNAAKAASARMTHAKIGRLVGVSKMTISQLRDGSRRRVPPAIELLQRLASTTGQPLPDDVAMVVRDARDQVARAKMRPKEKVKRPRRAQGSAGASRKPGVVRSEVPEDASARDVHCTLEEECLAFGKRLARLATPTQVDRNAQLFAARFGAFGPETTLEEIGKRHQMTRERVRQIVDKMLARVPEFVGEPPVLALLVARLAEMAGRHVDPADGPEVRALLGPSWRLEDADRYARTVFARSLPGAIKSDREKADELRMSEAVQDAVSYQGAANLGAVAGLMWASGAGAIDGRTLLREIEKLPGFQWIDATEGWFWLGPARRGMWADDVYEVLAVAPDGCLVDVEEIQNGVARARTRLTRQTEIPSLATVRTVIPHQVASAVLRRTPGVLCRQTDDFALDAATKAQVEFAEAKRRVIEVMAAHQGVASRVEIRDSLAASNLAMNIVTLGVVLDSGAMVRRIDRGVYGLCGWPLEPEAYARARASVGGPSQGKIVVALGDEVTWELELTKGSVRNRVVSVPAGAKALPLGVYALSGGGHVKVVQVGKERRVAGLVREARRREIEAGDRMRVSFRAADWTGTVERIHDVE